MVFSCILGWLFHIIIRKLKVDIKYPVFRFANHWHYYFKGEILAFSDFKNVNNRGQVLSTLVDVVMDVEEGDKKKMLSGILTQYVISPRTGELETIYLTNPTRFSASKNMFVEIQSDCLIIPYHRVIDMNLRYIIKEDNSRIRERLISSVISIFIFFGLLFVLIAPWFVRDVGFVQKLISVILLIVDWLIFLTIILSFQKKIDNSLEGKSLKVAIFTFIILTLSVLILLKCLNFDFIQSLYQSFNLSNS
jgi:sporulation protein YlmC with PRC-barrel domain